MMTKYDTALYAPLLWTGESDEVLRDVTLICERGMLIDIVAGRSPNAADLGNAAIIPPLVNAHCHLEFSQLKQPFHTKQPFSKWIGETMRTRRENQNVSESIRTGIEESSAAGIEFLADVKTQSTDCYPDFEEIGLEVILFQEVIGLTDEAVDRQRELISSFVQEAGCFRLGLSPHAPFTVRPDLLEFCVRMSQEAEVPLMMHLAETQAELELLAEGTGELVEMLSQFGMWSAGMYPSGTQPLDLLKILSQAPRVLLAHGNYLDEQEIQFLAEHPQMHIVYCPRTHHYFGHSLHPWQSMLEAGVNVALGTDGRGSNPDLSIWNEVRFLMKQLPDVEPRRLLEMATINGAKSLGMDTTIQIGRPANWTVLVQKNSDAKPMTSLQDLLLADVWVKGDQN
ncbi:amidohydrolase family protein [Rubinisphaera sp.]|uniref:amidohydrolase family protein n=1 Tax=Rubinisphaera sp. TaxID=2024857 RepID=UPI000C107ED5|nr:amidohydrolase family protein [Rubinisphaera sp.]MBV08155.1 chlorohydrolase [Rubinisphaera sp.]|tara:strand:+ start:3483 stop:4673 length:1191 start_codon:yes stop_codon:yes gene_type:complete